MISKKAFLWVYFEVSLDKPISYGTFITCDEAKNLFGGKKHYRLLTIQDIADGISINVKTNNEGEPNGQ